jgi:hypothetical protein
MFTETHVKPGILEHLEQLSCQLTSSQKQFTAYKTRLSVVRTAKEQLQIEGKNIIAVFTKIWFQGLYKK